MGGLVDDIVDLEWDFFQAVENEGGRASCQNDRRTFDLMRKSQFKAWGEDALESYLRDLSAAKATGGNPLQEKYARMMEYTDPEAYEKIKNRLPSVSEEKKRLVGEIVAIQMPWQEEYARRYPRLAARSRPVASMSDQRYSTSVETYLRGELTSYSEVTLVLYLRRAREVLAAGGNLTLVILEDMVKRYGYESIQDAEDAIAANAT